MPKVFHKRNGSWTEVKSIFHKRNGAWTEVLNVFRRTSGAWVKVFSAAKIPGNTVAPTITGTGYLFSTLTNNSLGTWTNSPTSYTRQWRRGNPTSGGGEPTSYSNISGATSSTYTTTSSDDGKYIICQITATNAVGSNIAVSNFIYVNKYAPESLLPYTLSGSSTVGSTLTAQEQIGSWKNTTTNTGDTYPDTFEYEWSYSDGTIRQSTEFNSINSNSYTIVSSDLNKVIRVRVTGTNTGGSATSAYTSSGTVTEVYSFAFGNTLYVGSNGYIGLDNGGNVAAVAGAGRNVNIWNEDLVQYRLQEYSDNSNYYLYFRAYRYQSPLVRSATNALDYQIKFYTNQPYCDVYLVRAGASVPTYINNPGFYSNGLFSGTGIAGPFFWGAGSVLRVYFNGTVASTSAASWSTISDSVWKSITTADIDDSFTTVVTSPNQQAAVVIQNTAPTARATNTFSSSIVKYLDSITWSSGTYSNASSVSSVLLYSTNTSNLVDPGGNTSSSFRTANPYTIQTSDPAGTPYVFAVRDTVVGTNGTTYYFYSNQITSANADAVAFSYGTATSASGGWTASINAGTQSSAIYSFVSATVGSGSVNSSTGEVTASGLSASQSSTITVQKSVSGYNSTTATASGSALGLTKLATPTGVNATDTRSDGVNVTWNSVSGAAYYGVWYGSAPSYDSLADFGGNRNTSLITGTSYLDTAVGNGVTRDYYVQAYRSGDPTGTKSEWGGPDSGTRANLVVNYTVTWNANGGSVSPSSNVVTAGSSVTAPTPTRSGYTFDYWYDNSFSYIVYAGGSFTPPSSITMNASWTQIVVQTPAITSGPNISWASGNNFTLSATASNATNLEFQVQFANNDGGPALSTRTFFFGASTGGGTTGAQQYSWARTRVRANNTSTGLSSSFSAYTGWA